MTVTHDELDRVLIPQNLRQLVITSPFRTGIRESSKVMVENENGSISEVNVKDYWFPARKMSQRQRKRLTDSAQVKMYGPRFDKLTGEVYFEYVSETQDVEIASKMVDEAWALFHEEQRSRETQLNKWLEQNNLRVLNSMYASTF